MRTPLTAALRRIVLGAGVLMAASAITTRAVAQELRDEYHTAPRDTVSQEVYDGWKQFNLNCARCHGEDALGTTIAPHLIMSLKPDGPINTKELFVQTVCAGRPDRTLAERPRRRPRACARPVRDILPDTNAPQRPRG